jgi:NAD(P)-dependent dehydrogenase (short-subunit alcohol dehydrogenase family)
VQLIAGPLAQTFGDRAHGELRGGVGRHVGLVVLYTLGSKQLAEPDWEVADALAGGVVDCVHSPRAPILEITDKDWHRGLDIYLMTVIHPTLLVTPVMQNQKSGTIINNSTAWAFEPSAMFRPPRCLVRALPLSPRFSPTPMLATMFG